MKVLSFLLLIPLLSHGMEYSVVKALSAPGIGEVDVLHNQSGFFVIKDGFMDAIENHNVDPALRVMNIEKFKAFTQMAKVKVFMNDKKEYILRPAGQLKGGGAVTGLTLAWIVRAALYTPPAVVGVTATVATSGAAITMIPAAVPGISGYMTTVEGTATAFAIIGYAIPWLP